VQRALGVAACALVAAGIVAAFFAIGSPSRARVAALDRVRLGDLYGIADALHDRFGRNAELPATLPSDLSGSDGGRSEIGRNPLKDPTTGTPYAYRRLNRERYQLCAKFTLPLKSGEAGGKLQASSWKHAAGTACFAFDVRKAVIEPESVDDSPLNGTPPF
jgi:hypothetical protein